mgnify:CR=1 FL=1
MPAGNPGPATEQTLKCRQGYLDDYLSIQLAVDLWHRSIYDRPERNDFGSQ